MKYYVSLKGKTYEVEVDESGASLLGEYENGDAPAARPVPVKQAAVNAAPVQKSAAPAQASPAPQVPTVPVAPSAPAPQAVGAGAVTSPMPGSILDIRVSEGQQVSDGDVVMILEAMKMENEIIATSSGTVQKIHVSKGQAVQTGTLLLVIA